MREASAEFANVITGSHEVAVRVDVLFNREVILEGLNVVAGSVEFDRTRPIRSTLDLELAEPTRLPTGSSNILSPYGYELRVWRGVRVAGTDHLVALGTFPIQRSTVQGVTLATSIQAEDRARQVADARFTDAYTVAAGTNYATAIQALIEDGVDGLEFSFPTTTFTTPALVFDLMTDRWEAARQMATSIGMELFFDGLGVCTMRPEPTFDANPVATIATGTNFVDATVMLDRSTAYNGVIAVGNNPAVGPVRGEAFDLNPESPTYYNGPFGRKPRMHYSEFYASDAQAASGAAAILAANLGVARSTEATVVPDPRIEASDVVDVQWADLSLSAVHIIDAGVIGLGPEDPMVLTVRAQLEAS